MDEAASTTEAILEHAGLGQRALDGAKKHVLLGRCKFGSYIPHIPGILIGMPKPLLTYGAERQPFLAWLLAAESSFYSRDTVPLGVCPFVLPKQKRALASE